MDNSDMFKNTTLKIIDIVPFDVTKVYNYFDYYNLATIKNVTHYYNMETNYTGYLIVEIEKWHNNTSAKIFYNAIDENKGKIMHDDPHYWDVQFHNTEFIKPNIHLKIKVQEDDSDNEEEVKEEEKEVKEIKEVKEEKEELDEDEEYYEYEDETKDLTYMFYKKYDNNSRTNKKRIYSAFIENLKAENNELRELLIKKQKNYKKNNKKKDNKFSWHRRLRVKEI